MRAAMSAFGTKRTSLVALHMSAFKADILDRKADIGLAPITVFIGCNRSRRQLRKGRVVFRRRYSYASGEEASPKDMCQSVAKLSWIFRPISVQDPCLVEQQMRHVLLE